MLKLKNVLVVASIALLSACGSTSKESEGPKHSGYLSNYNQLKKVESNDDDVVMQWKSEEYAKRSYKKVIIDDIVFYPKPKDESNAVSKVLNEIAAYSNNSIQKAAASTGKLTDMPGDDTIRLKMAVTGASIDDQGLSGINYLPIAFLASAATGNLDNLQAKMVFEGEITDSKTGELLATFMRTGLGEEVDDENTALSLDMLKPVIDGWVDLVKDGINRDLN